jgi:hypothetical protein
MGNERYIGHHEEKTQSLPVPSLQQNTVKPAHEVTSIKQSSVLKGNLFPVLS